MNDFWYAGLYGVLSGVIGTGAGGLLACFLPVRNKCIISFLLEFSAGLMLSIVCFNLLPTALTLAPFSLFVLGIMIGILIMTLSEGLFIDEKQNSIAIGLSTTLGITIHHFLEGMAVGSGFEAEKALGVSLMIAIMLHDVPEGISIALPLRVGGMKPTKAIFLALGAGLPTGLGAIMGAWLGRISVRYIPMSLAIAGGAMLYIVFMNILDESRRLYEGRLSSIGSIIGMISGIILCTLLG